MPVDHYENFPVASFMLPARLRAAVTDIYWFAREADDIADEGDCSPAERIAALDARERELDRIAGNAPPWTPLFVRLAEHIREHHLPLQLFRDLLDAFRQDVTKHRYADFGEVMSYCRRSANPVGRLLLHLFRETTPRSLALSDGICSSLQLVNFLQDVAADYRRGRVYLAQDELARHRLDDSTIAAGEATPAWCAFMGEQTERARRIMTAGAPLGSVLRGRAGFEVRMIVAGGLRILEKLAAVEGDIFHRRPTLGLLDWPRIFIRAAVR